MCTLQCYYGLFCEHVEKTVSHLTVLHYIHSGVGNLFIMWPLNVPHTWPINSGEYPGTKHGAREWHGLT